MIDQPQRTYCRVRPEYRGELRRSKHKRDDLPVDWLAQKEQRIAAETARVQAALARLAQKEHS